MITMDFSHYAGIAVVMCAAAVLQSAVGFGYALLATPLLLWLGISLPQAIVIVTLVSFVQSAISAWRLRGATPWRPALLATGGSMAAMLPGVFLLKRLVALRIGKVHVVVGLLLILLVALQWTFRPRPRARLHWGWAICAYGGCGLLTGVSGMGGPPLVLWSLAHDWQTEKTRGFLLTVFTLMTPLQLALLYATLGMQAIYQGLTVALLLVPTAFLGAAIGLALGHRLSPQSLRSVALSILLVIGLMEIGRGVW